MASVTVIFHPPDDPIITSEIDINTDQPLENAIEQALDIVPKGAKLTEIHGER